jgi:hypothetical protein
MSEETWIPLGDSSIYGWQGNLYVEPPKSALSLAVSIPLTPKWKTKESSENK